MNAIAQLVESFLYSISSFLYFPVILGVAGFCVYGVYLLGVFAREWRERQAGQTIALARYQQALADLLTESKGQTDDLIQARVERLLQSTELEYIKQLDKVRFMIRTGPALGLMGTLIPMGTALASLAEGNIPNMASSMVGAFTATVAGLFSSVMAYLIAMGRERWLRADIREMEFHTEITLHTHSQHQREDALAEELSA
jgi:biopolymer transport protein ExbB/TolQ